MGKLGAVIIMILEIDWT